MRIQYASYSPFFYLSDVCRYLYLVNLYMYPQDSIRNIYVCISLSSSFFLVKWIYFWIERDNHLVEFTQIFKICYYINIASIF